MKKGRPEGKGKARGAGKGSGSGGAAAAAATPTWPSGPVQCAIKLLASDSLVPAIIGKGGAVIDAMRSSCKAKLQFTEYGEVFPGTESRVLTVMAVEESQIDSVIEQVLAKIVEVGQAEEEEEEAESDDVRLSVLVPRAACGSLIGKGGATVKQLRESSGAKINISDTTLSGPASDQLVDLSGEAEAVKKAAVAVSGHIQALKNEGWFATWAATPGTVSWAYSDIASAGGSATGTGRSGYNPGADLITKVAHSLPSYVFEDSRGFALSCVVPENIVGGLIGRGGAGTREIQTLTGAKIGIREIPDDAENRSLNIVGPFPAACAAYMLMMKRYLDVEEQVNWQKDPQEAADGGSWSY